MSKFKQGLMKQIKTEKKEEQEQMRLREKHHIGEENIRIVERDNMCKFLIRNLAAILRTAVSIVVFVLAVAGTLSLVYPEIRNELFCVLQEILAEGRALTGI